MIEGISDLQKDISKINEYVRVQMAQNAFSPENPLNTSTIAGFPSPIDYINYFKMIAKKLDTPEGALFLAKEGILKSMNPVLGMGKLYNPASALSPPPFAAGEVTDFLESPVASANQTENIIRREDRLLALAEGRFTDVNKLGTMDVNIQVNQLRYSDGKTIALKNAENNLFSPEQPSDKFEYLDNTNWQDGGRNGRKRVKKNNVEYDVPDITKMFDQKSKGPSFLDGNEKGALFFKPRTQSRSRIEIELDSQDWVNNQDTFFSQQDFENGYSEEDFLDGDLYVPFYFIDLRKPDRKVLFRAFLDNFTESIAPKWQQEEYFGRIDPVAMYKNTTRTINVSFKIMPLSPPGFSAMWRKINHFAKMCYPSFRNGAITRSPVIRMRIGDVIADAGGNGLPGFIDKLELNYSNSPWEIQSFAPNPNIELGKAPMKIEVSMTFVVIHEQNPSLDDEYNMDFTTFRRIGSNQQDSTAAVDFSLEETNQNGTTEGESTTTTSQPPEEIS